MYTYKITFRRQFRHAMPIIPIAIAVIAIIYWLYRMYGSDGLTFDIVFSSIAFAVQFIPLVLLHRNYYNINKSDTYSFNEENNEMQFFHSDKKVVFYPEDVRVLTLYKSFPLAKNNPPFLAFDSYHHGVIILNDGTKVIITSLMFDKDIALPLPDEKVHVEMNFYRWVSSPSLQLNNQ